MRSIGAPAATSGSSAEKSLQKMGNAIPLTLVITIIQSSTVNILRMKTLTYMRIPTVGMVKERQKQTMASRIHRLSSSEDVESMADLREARWI